jgi:hypothetical protein
VAFEVVVVAGGGPSSRVERKFIVFGCTIQSGSTPRSGSFYRLSLVLPSLNRSTKGPRHSKTSPTGFGPRSWRYHPGGSASASRLDARWPQNPIMVHEQHFDPRFRLNCHHTRQPSVYRWGVYASKKYKHGHGRTFGGSSRSYLASKSRRHWHLLLVDSHWCRAPPLLRST